MFVALAAMCGEAAESVTLVLDPATSRYVDPAGKVKPVAVQRGPDGQASAVLSSKELPKLSNAITVEAWIEAKGTGAEALQSLVSKWSPREPFDGFAAYDASMTDGQSIRLYIDGKLVAEREASGEIQPNDVDVAVGRIGNGLGYFNGTIKKIRVSAEARSAEQIQGD